MKVQWLASLTLLSVSLPMHANDAPKGFETDNVVLYQSDEALQARVGAVEDLANYIKQLQAVCGDFFAGAKTPETLRVARFVDGTPAPHFALFHPDPINRECGETMRILLHSYAYYERNMRRRGR